MANSNTHRSSALVKILVAYSAGETGGIVGATTDEKAGNIYFNDTPLASGNTYNFQGVTFDERFGTANQTPIKGFANATSVVGVGTQITKDGGPVVRVVSSSEVDSIRVVISSPQLAKYHDDGNDQVTFELKFEVKDPASGVWENRGTKSFTGKSFTALEIDYEIDGPTTITGPWSVRVTRITDDSTNSKLLNDTYFQRIIEVRESRETYPDTALVGLRFDLDQFGGDIPQVSFKVKGIKVRVPNNYYETLEQALAEDGVDTGFAKDYPLYDGNWDGGFKWAVTSNPAWHFYHLAYNTTYGAGIDRAYVDKWGLYSIAKYCDAVSPVADASGYYKFVGVNYVDPDDGNQTKKRRRFTLNTVLTSPEDALTVLQNIASAFRGMAYYGAGAFIASQDQPRDLTTSRIVTNENVLEGKFHYQTTEAKMRTTVARVTFNDRTDHYRAAFVQYPEEDDIPTDAGVKRYGRNLLEVTKFGCDNAAEALAYAKYLVYTALNETRTVTFTAGPEHAALRPGEVIRVFDRRFMKERFGGRILANSTATRVNLDKAVVLASGKNYQITIIGNDGKTVYTRDVTSNAGSRSSIDCNSFGFTPTAGYTWAIAGGDIQPQTFRVAYVSKKSALEYEVKAAQYDFQKYAAVEQGKTPKPIPYIRDEYVIVNAPTNIVFKKTSVNDPVTGKRNDLTVGWTASTSKMIKGYTYQWRRESGPWSTPTFTKRTNFDIQNITKGIYEVRITAENVQGRKSLTAEGSYEFVYAGGGSVTIFPPILIDPV